MANNITEERFWNEVKISGTKKHNSIPTLLMGHFVILM